jgi:cell division protein ZapE
MDALAKKPGLLRRTKPPRGLYIWGEAGRGKTLLMDTFFGLAPEPRKRRAHFHAFMAQAHERLATLRAARGEQPIEVLAKAMADETRLLCLDEVQVKDIADATVLGRLFAELIERGTVIVATSNAPPARLYYKGLNRDLFLPFIALIEKQMDVVKLDSRRDYRLERLAGGPLWHAPPDTAAMDAAFARLTGAAHGAPETLRVKGRDVTVPDALNGVARFSFAELCEQPRGAADFAAIACTYHTLVVDNIPRLDTAPQDAVRRFIILIDELYEYRVKLVASAHCTPDMLLTRGKQAWDFQRTASRLAEMGSRDWLSRPHGQDADLNGGREPG